MLFSAVTFLFFQFRMVLVTTILGLWQAITSSILKMIIFPASARPLTFLKEQYPLELVEGVTQLYFRSFPSGHTMTAFSLATFLAFMTRNPLLQFALFFYAFLIGFSRIYLSHHFLIDVLFGAAFGLSITLFGLCLNQKTLLFNNPLLNGKLKL